VWGVWSTSCGAQKDPAALAQAAAGVRLKRGREALRGSRELLRCDNETPGPGHDATLRLLVSANRTGARVDVSGGWRFASFELAQKTPEIVGVNLTRQLETEVLALAPRMPIPA
jgi:hypothetical protein